MIEIILDSNYEKVFNLCQKYSTDETYVYKTCGRGSGMTKYLVVMQKVEGTKTNEIRTVVNPDYAKYRASELKVIEIINTNDITEKYLRITNVYSNIKTVYEKGKMVYPDNYDKNPNSVCASGIHYFKTIIPALFYTDIPKRFTGIWYEWNDNGAMIVCDNYLNGVLHGKTKRWNYVTGHEESVGTMVDGKKDGEWITWESHGLSNEYFVGSRGKYTNDKPIGIWTFNDNQNRKAYQIHSGKYENLDNPILTIDSKFVRNVSIIAGTILACYTTYYRIYVNDR